MKYRTRMLLRPDLPDDRLIQLQQHPNGLMTFMWRSGFIHPELLRDLDELSRHISNAGVLVYREEGEDPETAPSVDLWVDTLDPEYLSLQTMTGYARWTGQRLNFGAIVRSDMISVDIVKEFNDEPMKWGSRALKPGMPPPRSKLILPGSADF